MHLTIRPETPNDVAAIHEVNSLAFGRQEEADLVDALRGSEAWVPALSLVAVRETPGGEVVVGHALFCRIQIEGDGGEVEALSLGPVAVRPENQHAGVGGLLIRAGLEHAEELGFRAVVVLGHPEYYPRFGFLPATQFGLTVPYDAPEEAVMAMRLRPDGLVGISGRVRYPPAFDSV
jgi:putative acetyltransferase